MSTDDVAKSLGWSKSKVSRIETAAVTVAPDDARALLPNALARWPAARR